MNLKFRTLAAVVAAGTALGVVGLAAPAFAAQGTATPTTTSGVDTSRPFFTISACTPGSSALNATLAWPSGSGQSTITALGTTSTGFSLAANMSKQLGDTWLNIANSNPGHSLVAGLYTVTFQCLDGFGTVVPNAGAGDTGTRVAQIYFTSATAWQAIGSVLPVAATITSDVATQTVGGNVTLTATLSPAPTVAGTVQFTSDGTNIGAVQNVASGATTASITRNDLGVSAGHTISAVYTPTNAALPAQQYSAGAVTTTSVAITKAAPTAALVFSPPSGANLNSPITLFCNVSGGVSGPSQVTFTHTVPGGVAFTTAPVAITGGVASLSLGKLSQGTLNASCATVVDANNASGASGTQSLAIAGVDSSRVATEFIDVTVNAGALQLSVQGIPVSINGTPDTTVKIGTPIASPAYPVATNSTNVVILPAANINDSGDYIITDGNIIPVKAVDTRAGDPGYNVTGLLSNLVGSTKGTNVNAEINASNVGWNPLFISSSRFPGAGNSTDAHLTNGAFVAPADGLAWNTSSTAGLGGLAKTLYTAPANFGTGTVYYGAHLSLKAPTNTPADTYEGVLTLTANG
jgi:hypothetical protein